MSSLKFKRFDAGDFDIRETVGAVGDTFNFAFAADTPNEKMPFVNVVTGGSFSLGPFPDNSSIVMNQGHSGHLNTNRPAGKRTLTCLVGGSTYLCISPKNGGAYRTRRLERNAGQQVLLHKGATYVLAKGSVTIDGQQKLAPVVLVIQSANKQCDVVTDAVLIEMELK